MTKNELKLKKTCGFCGKEADEDYFYFDRETMAEIDLCLSCFKQINSKEDIGVIDKADEKDRIILNKIEDTNRELRELYLFSETIGNLKIVDTGIKIKLNNIIKEQIESNEDYKEGLKNSL